MDFTNWFKEWLARHPLREPVYFDQARYTAEVMARVNDQIRSPAQQARRSVWLCVSWPRMALGGLSFALVSIIVLLAGVSYSRLRLAKEVTRGIQVLAEVGESATPVESETDEVAVELQAEDTLVLAEATKTDDQWLEQTVQILEQLDEDPKAGNANGSSEPDEDWLDDLQMLDNSELSSSS